jgi:hypothetical protein
MDQNVKTSKLCMILERSTHKLELSKEDGYVLEGTAAVFGEENNNQRIYEEKEYLPHLEYLQKKIEKRSLMGELDHPEKFDVALKNASHIVEALTYDPSKRELRIKVRLLDTPNGRIAKNLVDAGVPVSISSRAAGVVESDKKVKIKRIFTYDLVADPGFENAQLSRVNESLGFGKVENINFYDISKDKNLYENFIKEMEKEGIKTENNTDMDNNNQPNYVKVEELHAYSLLLTKELRGIKETLKTIQSKPMNESAESVSRLSKLENYVNYLAENVDKNIQYSEYLAENMDKNIDYTKYLAENLDRNISYAEYLAENLDTTIGFGEYLGESLNGSINYAQYLGENLDTTINFGDYIGEKLDKNIGYTEYLAENLDQNITNFKELNEKVKIGNANKINETEKIEKNPTEERYIGSKGKETVQESISNKYKEISSKVDSLLESVQKQKTEESLNESSYKFFKLLSEEKKKTFLSLTEAQKTKVTLDLDKTAYSCEDDIVKVIESATKPKTEIPKFISAMPENLKPIWESLDKRSKEAIIAQSYSYNLDTPYQINHFWNTRKLKDIPVLEKLNENASVPAAPVKVNLRGYNSDYMKDVMAGLDKYKTRK